MDDTQSLEKKMPLEIIYCSWGCGEEKIEAVPSEDQTRSEMIVWNLCPDCIDVKGKRSKNNITSQVYLGVRDTLCRLPPLL